LYFADRDDIGFLDPEELIPGKLFFEGVDGAEVKEFSAGRANR
jgi:hypothetical protein